jgi:hypothetical protein
MSDEELEKLKTEIQQSCMDEVRKYQMDYQHVEFVVGDLSVPEIIQRGVFQVIAKIRNWTICLVKQPLKHGVVTLVIMLSLLFEALHVDHALPEHINQIQGEVSVPAPWADTHRPIINRFVLVPPIGSPHPHPLEDDFLRNPNPNYVIASVTGLSPQVSGFYQG